MWPVSFRSHICKFSDILIGFYVFLKKFFNDERGSISVTQATCFSHRIDVANSILARKTFTSPFRDAILGLYLVTNKSVSIQDVEFKRFINEFGTHYSSQTYLGVKMYSEFRYSENETLQHTDEHLKTCATEGVLKLIGIPSDRDIHQCIDPALVANRLASDFLPRFSITTLGSFSLTSQASQWSKRIRQMSLENTLIPVPLKRRLRPIVELFDGLQVSYLILTVASSN